MSVSQQAVSVGTAATRLDPITDGTIPKGSCAIRNNGAAIVYIGASGVTTANGYPLDPGREMSADLGPGDALYGIVASGTVECRVVEVGGNN